MHLLVMRHGQAEGGGPDRDRPLTPRGREDVAAAAVAAAGAGLVPAAAVVSPARRTLETHSAAAAAAGWPAEPVLAEALYGGGPHDLLEALGQAPAVDVMALVGHQPGVSALLMALTGGYVAMAPGALAAVGFPGALAAGAGALTALWPPGQ